jgi:hypothetical protein
MTIKQQGGVFGRNPTFNDADIDNNLSVGNVLNVDNGTLYVDPVNNRVGIGTTTPASDFTLSDGKVMRLYRFGNAIYTDISYAAGTGLSINDANGDGIRFQFASSDQAYINTNGLAFPSGKGIDFSATAGTGTSELLDDYEEGVWTPLISQDGDGAVPFTSVTQSGAYTKVGNLVTVTCLYEYSGIGSVGNNFAYMGGLPFTAADNSIYGYGFSFFEQSAFDTKSYSIAALSNAAKAFFQYDNGGGTLYVGTPRMVGNSFPSAAKVRFTLTYIAV